jgi:hypothetical protein
MGCGGIEKKREEVEWIGRRMDGEGWIEVQAGAGWCRCRDG